MGLDEALVLGIPLVAVLTVLTILSLKKQKSGLKTILLGIAVIICGGVAVLNMSADLFSLESLIILSGFIITLAGFFKKEQ